MIRSLVFTFALLVPSAARADGLDAITARGALVWGGDEEGGAPYIYRDDKGELVGFETELMALVAAELGVKSQFHQCQWDKLRDELRTNRIDIIVNGYELTAPQLDDKLATLPYYVYELQMMARKGDESLRGWDDLRAKEGKPKKRVGVLLGTAAEEYLKKNYGADIEIVSYDSSTQALDEVKNLKIDASVTDNVAVTAYLDRYPTLQIAGPAVGRGFYVMYVRPGEERLRDAVNRALLKLVRSGQIRAIDSTYKIWNARQAEFASPADQDAQTFLLRLLRATVEPGGEEEDGTQAAAETEKVGGLEVIRRNWRSLLVAAGWTVVLSLASFPLAILLGLTIALGRLYGPAPMRWLFTIYVEVIRGTPLLLQLFVIFYVLPELHFTIPAIFAGVIGLALNYSAYEAEIYRAGLLAIPAGQMEAALSLGLTRGQALRHVVVPQAMRLVVPPVTNDFIALFKDTAVCSVITIVELSKQYSILANNTGAYVQLAAVTAGLYLVMSYPLALLSRRLERRAVKVHT